MKNFTKMMPLSLSASSDGDGMLELQAFGMQKQALSRLSVEGVTANRAVHAVRMGGVYTELVRAAGLGIVGYTGACFSSVIQRSFATKNLGITKRGVTEILRFALDDSRRG